MLNSLASYLLGYPGSSSPAVAPAEEPATVTAHVPCVDVRLSAVEADDDWLLVDKTDTEEESASVDAPSVPSSTRLTLAVSTTSYLCEERPGSGAGLEESWFVTPPPCFTSGSVPLETSPLENLLIEHPSMSVYHRSAGPGLGPQGAAPTLSSSVGASPPSRSPQRGTNVRKLNRPGSGASKPASSAQARTASSPSTSPSAASSPVPSEAVATASSRSSSVRPTGGSGTLTNNGASSVSGNASGGAHRNNAATVQPQSPPRRPNAYSPYHQQQQQQSAQYRAAQRLVQRAACQQLKRDSSERYNKAREILSSRNKRQRRSDRMQRHSGANNNRKC